MKKLILYIILLSIGIIIGFLLFYVESSKIEKTNTSKADYIAMNIPVEENPTDFIQSVTGMLGKTLIINGIVQEAYKNKNNELVIYLKDKKIPLLLNCTIFQADIQIKWAIKLGEPISLQGIFTELDDQMHLQNCRIISRLPDTNKNN